MSTTITSSQGTDQNTQGVPLTINGNSFVDQQLDPNANPETNITNVTVATGLSLDANGNLVSDPNADTTKANIIKGTDSSGSQVTDINITGSNVVADLTLTQTGNNNTDQCSEAIDIMNKIKNIQTTNIGNLGDYANLLQKINNYSNENHSVSLNIPEVANLKGFADNISELGALFNTLQIHVNNSQSLDASAVLSSMTDSLTRIYNSIIAIEKFKVSLSETTQVSVPQCLVDVTSNLVNVNSTITNFMGAIDYFTADPSTLTEAQKEQYGLSNQSKTDIIKVEKALDFLDTLYSQGAVIAFQNDQTVTSLAAQLNHFSDPALNSRVSNGISKFKSFLGNYPNIGLPREH